MKTSIRIALLIGIVGLGSYATTHLTCPTSTLVIYLIQDGHSKGSSSSPAAWGNTLDYDATWPGGHYHYKIRVLSADRTHATLSYSFTGDNSKSAQGTLAVGEKATQTPLQLDRHITLLAYVKPNT